MQLIAELGVQSLSAEELVQALRHRMWISETGMKQFTSYSIAYLMILADHLTISELQRLLMLHMYLSSERKLTGALLLLAAQANKSRARIYAKHVTVRTEQINAITDMKVEEQ